MSTTANFIKAVADDDKEGAAKAFESMMQSKTDLALDIKKVALTSEIYKKED